MLAKMWKMIRDISTELREYLKSGGTKKFLRIPTLVGGRVKGFIGIRHGDRPPYRPEEIELAQALAHQAMLAIQLNEFAEQSRQAAVLEERNRIGARHPRYARAGFHWCDRAIGSGGGRHRVLPSQGSERTFTARRRIGAAEFE